MAIVAADGVDLWGRRANGLEEELRLVARSNPFYTERVHKDTITKREGLCTQAQQVSALCQVQGNDGALIWTPAHLRTLNF